MTDAIEEQGGEVRLESPVDAARARRRPRRRGRGGRRVVHAARRGHLVAAAARDRRDGAARAPPQRGARRGARAALPRLPHRRARRRRRGPLPRQLDLHPRAERARRPHPELPLVVAVDGPRPRQGVRRPRVLLLRRRRPLDDGRRRRSSSSRRRELEQLGLAPRRRSSAASRSACRRRTRSTTPTTPSASQAIRGVARRDREPAAGRPQRPAPLQQLGPLDADRDARGRQPRRRRATTTSGRSTRRASTTRPTWPDEHPYRTAPETPEMQALAASAPISQRRLLRRGDGRPRRLLVWLALPDGLVDAAERRRGADDPASATSRSRTSSTSSRRSAAAARCTSGSSTSCSAGGRASAALRVPSLVFVCLALPAVALIARRARSATRCRAGVVLLTAASPIPVLYATFGRPHTLLFAWLMWATVLALRGGRRGDRRLLGRLAGAVLGLAVFVHPTAPLYALTALSRRVALRAALAALGDARGVAGRGRAARRRSCRTTCARCTCSATATASVRQRRGGRTFSGRPVWEDAIHFVAPGAHDVNYFTVARARRGRRAARARGAAASLAFCVLTVAAPIVFFSVVPAIGDSALFFDRYMIPATRRSSCSSSPACLRDRARWAGAAATARRSRSLVAGLARHRAALRPRHRRRRRSADRRRRGRRTPSRTSPPGIGALRLDGDERRVLLVVRLRPSGEPARPLRRAARRLASSSSTTTRARARCRTCTGAATPALRASGSSMRRPRTRPRRAHGVRAARRRPCRRCAGHYFVVRSPRRRSHRARLIRLGQSYRLAWRRAVPLNRRVNELLHRRPPAPARAACCRRTAISATRASRRTGRRSRRPISRKTVGTGQG